MMDFDFACCFCVILGMMNRGMRCASFECVESLTLYLYTDRVFVSLHGQF